MKKFPNENLNKGDRKHIVINNIVFDVTDYVSRHPGKGMILKAPSFDSIECMISRHGRNMDVLEKRLKELAVGVLAQKQEVPIVD